jgi:hypothetical protein
MLERPSIFNRFAWLYSCSFVRLLPPDELPDLPLDRLPRALAEELRDLPLDELALARDRLVPPDEPVRLVFPLLLPLDRFDAELLPLDRFEAELLPLDRFEPELLLPLDRFEPELLLPLDRFEAELPRRVACEDRLRPELPDFGPVCPER